MSESSVHNWQDLANAIILRAVADYRRAHDRNRMRPEQPETLHEIRNIEQFFCSEWFSVLCTLDGRKILRKLKKQIASEATR